ncbi:MAG: hypothetical protein PF518_03175 [Spirochaetaceae bacterium]|jgi:predicted transcriptional regulator|nr:hypothetical protein [Spirochaetaceae bacterium]
MSKAISVKIRDDVFDTAEKMVKEIHVSRNAYINDAIAFYTKLQERKLLKEQLQKESDIVSGDSLETLRLFEAMDESILE